MPKFKKKVLEVGTYQSPDGEVKVTTERLNHWANSFDKMRGANIGIPVSWDHANDPAKSIPQQLSGKRRRKTEGTVGYMDSFKVAEDGGSAEITLNIPNSADAEKVKDNLAYFSPVIYGSWKDGRGESYPDCITHGDLVQHPVDNSQGEFTPVEEVVACSLRMGLETQHSVYRMGDFDKKKKFPGENDQDQQADDAADPDMAANAEEPGKKPDGAKDPDTTEEPEETEVINNANRLTNVKEALGSMQIVLSEDTNEINFLAHLEQALLTAAAMNGDEMGTEDLQETTPEFAALSLESKKWRLHADKTHRAAVSSRLTALLDNGQCTPAELEAKTEKLDAVRLSLDDSGVHQDSNLESWIESRETCPRGSFWDDQTRTKQMGLDTVPQPKSGVIGNDEANSIADELFKN